MPDRKMSIFRGANTDAMVKIQKITGPKKRVTIGALNPGYLMYLS